MNRYTLALAALLIAWLPPAVQAQVKTPHSVRGASVTIRATDQSSIRGELIGVQADTLWIMRGTSLNGISFADIRQVDVQTTKIQPSTFMTYSLIGGLVTSGALTLACNSVTSGCGGLFIASLGVWTGFSVLALPELNRQSRIRLGNHFHTLQPYARFPHAWPDGSGIRCLLGEGPCDGVRPLTAEDHHAAAFPPRYVGAVEYDTRSRRVSLAVHGSWLFGDPTDEIRQALTADGWEVGTPPTQDVVMGIGASAEYRPRQRLAIRAQYASAAERSVVAYFSTYDWQTNTGYSDWYSVTYDRHSLALTGSYLYGPVRVGLGPNVMVTSWRENHASPRSETLFGLALTAGIQMPVYDAFFLDADVGYRLMPAHRLAPHHGQHHFRGGAVPMSHATLSLGFGVQF
jgi:hypothetical protein